MIEHIWNPLPFPLFEVATPRPGGRLEMCGVLERLFEDAAGLAGVIATAAAHPESDQQDVQYATRFLSEHLHAAVALWWQWQAQEQADETTEPPPARAQNAPRPRRGTGTPGCAGKEGEA